MQTEIEAKIKVAELESYSQRLKTLQAEFLQSIVQRDHFFDLPDRSLKKADSGLRLRQESGPTGSRTIMCFKGPRDKNSAYKKRQEIEFKISSDK